MPVMLRTTDAFFMSAQKQPHARKKTNTKTHKLAFTVVEDQSNIRGTLQDNN